MQNYGQTQTTSCAEICALLVMWHNSLEKTHVTNESLKPYSSEIPVRAIVISGVIGAAIGITCYWCYAAVFEMFIVPRVIAPGTPMLSYGQEFGIIMTPLALLLGAAAGASTVPVQSRVRFYAFALIISLPVLVAVVVVSLWQSKFVRYGAEVTDLILFVPLLIGSALCFCWCVTLLAFNRLHLIVRRRVHKNSQILPSDQFRQSD